MPQYQIVGSDLQAVVCDLSVGEKVIGGVLGALLKND